MYCVLLLLFVFFFFKQKTAYEMRISDWSSDVCSSDLIAFAYEQGFAGIEDNFLKLRPEADQRRIGLELERRGLEMGCFVNNVRSWNTPLWSSSDKADREALRTELEQSIDTAKRVRGRVMTTLVGRRYDVPVAFQRAAVIENLNRVATLAESANVIIGLEAVNEIGRAHV